MAIKIKGSTVIYDDEVLRVSANTTTNRPATPVQGMIRYNTTDSSFEGYDGSAWGAIGGGGGGSTISNDTSTDVVQYLGMSRILEGTWSTAYISSSKLYFNPSNGQLSSTEFRALSDVNKKENIQIIENATEIVSQLEGVEYDWKDTKKHSSGVIAQQIEKILPHLVEENENQKTVNYNGLIAYLIQSIKELNEKIEKIEKNNI